MAEIKLTPEELTAQSAEMASLQSEYEGLFRQVTNSLNGINESWSENLASNFSGKIQSAQKSFSSVANMLLNGSSAARIGSLTFASGTGIGDILSGLMGNGASMPTEVSDLAKWIQEMGGDLTGEQGKWINEMLQMTGIDADTIKETAEIIKNGDTEGALKKVYDKWLDWTSGAISGGIVSGSWVDKIIEATGGTLGLANLEQEFYKNWIGGTLEKAAEVYIDSNSDNPDYWGELRGLCEMAWTFTAGAPLKTAGDAIWNVIEKIPGVGNWYADRGATDAESMFSVGLSEMTYAITGDQEHADYVRNYYGDHGGIAGGVVDGIGEIASFVWDEGVPVVKNAWNSIFGK